MEEFQKKKVVEEALEKVEIIMENQNSICKAVKPPLQQRRDIQEKCQQHINYPSPSSNPFYLITTIGFLPVLTRYCELSLIACNWENEILIIDPPSVVACLHTRASVACSSVSNKISACFFPFISKSLVFTIAPCSSR